MAFQYPQKPWTDGQEILEVVGGKELVIAKYDGSKNLWTHLHYNDEGEFFYTTACKVPVDFTECPCENLNADSLWEDTKNVQNALDWLHFQLVRLFDIVDALEERVKQNEVNIEFLYQTLSAIDNLADVTELLNKLEELEDRLDNLTAADVNQGTLDAGKFSMRTLPDGVAQGTQQETNYYLADVITQLSADNSLEHQNILQLIANLDEHTIWFGSTPPDDDDLYKFWWDSLRLELLINFNGQWWPVSIPPAQVEFLRQELDAIYESIGNTRRDIVYNKNDIDTLAMDVDGKLATLEEELEQLATSLERGSWTFTMNYPPGPGEYTMIEAFLDEDAQEALCNQEFADCQIAAAGDPVASAECSRLFNTCMNSIDGSRIVTTDDWTECDELVFNDVDMNGTNHGWGGIDSDHYIDVFNMNDENYMVGDIATHGSGTFSFDLVSSKGVATGPATVKIFKSEGTIDFDQYVRKQGDTMTGKLKMVDGNNDPSIATQPDHATTKAYVDRTSPIGTIVFWGGTIAKIPTGWVECRGQLAPESVKQITGFPYIPNLQDYMPAGAGGRFGANAGQYEQSRIKKHNHAWGGPADRKGYPSGSKDTSEGSANNQSYWRGNKSDSATSSYGLTSTSGDDITAPPVYLGVYIMRIS